MLKVHLYSSLTVCCLLLLAPPRSSAAQEVAAEDIAGTAHETDLISLSFGKIRLSNAIFLFSHMSAFNITYDPQIIPDVRVSVDVTDTPWTTVIADVLAKHDLALTKRGPGDYLISRVSSQDTPSATPLVDWQSAAKKHIRLRKIISQGDQNLAVLDHFGIVESGSTISAPFGPHVYTWRVNVSTNSISLRRDVVTERGLVNSPGAEAPGSSLGQPASQNPEETSLATPPDANSSTSPQPLAGTRVAQSAQNVAR